MDIKKYIEEYEPYNNQERTDKKNMLKFIDSFKDVLTRENTIGHFTASSWIVNKDRTKVLMVYHNIFDSWAWTGGHVDGDSDFLGVAIREAKEETGLKEVIPITNNIFGIDILTVDYHIKRGRKISAHLHLNVAYLLEADDSEPLFIKEDENSGVKWFDINKVGAVISEKKAIGIYNKSNEKLFKEKL